MKRVTLSEADHDRVTAAVAEAERHTDGEIVTATPAHFKVLPAAIEMYVPQE